MKLKKVGANKQCPCGSGKKHKRCCVARGLPWFDGGNRAVPYGIGCNEAMIHARLGPQFRDAVLGTAASLGLLDDLQATDTMASLVDRFDGSAMAAVMAELGMSGDLLLLAERLGDPPPPPVYDYWKKFGVIVTRRQLDEDERSVLVEALRDVIELYGVRAMLDTADGPTPCTFFVAPLLIDVPGIGFTPATTEDYRGQRVDGASYWPYTEARVEGIAAGEEGAG